MVENQPGNESKEDDLDLMNLVRRVFSFFRIYGRRIVIFSITGMLACLLLFKISPNLYESTLLLHSSTLTNSEQINIIENWNELLKNGEDINLKSKRIALAEKNKFEILLNRISEKINAR